MHVLNFRAYSIVVFVSFAEVSPQRCLQVLGSGRLKQVAMGQGQAVVALAAVREAAENGDWVCLKNMHLVTAWLPTLEKELNQLNPSPNFRIWLTTESHPKFSSIMLQSSLKITYEAPPGCKLFFSPEKTLHYILCHLLIFFPLSPMAFVD